MPAFEKALKVVHNGIESGAFPSSALFEKAITNHTAGLSESRGLGFKLTDERTRNSGELFCNGSYGHTGYTGTSIWVDAKTGFYIVLLTNRVHYGRENLQIHSARCELHNAAITEALYSF